jgi:hypothetical protein
MSEVPHLFVRSQIELNGKSTIGLASEGLPPKWFTKNPATTFDEDLPEMFAVIHHAAALAERAGERPRSFYELWREVHQGQTHWAAEGNLAPLLANLGVAICERALLDALGRALGRPAHLVIRENVLGIVLGELYPELSGMEPCDFLPDQPLTRLLARHTVGLTDPLFHGHIPLDERVDDGLPQDLESCIRAYGLCAFKIKLSGQAARDLTRLRALDALIRHETRGEFLYTLDGNENYTGFAGFRDFWEEFSQDESLFHFRSRLGVVEQPVHRNEALSDATGDFLRNWSGRPPLIIDESDGAVGDLARALELGYAGTSHKNCKGIVKGIANACLLGQAKKRGLRTVLTGEDLCNLGPVALLQDLAMMSLLGIAHVERNGHHYFRGLSPWPSDWQQIMQTSQPDVYLRDPSGLVRLDIRDGRIALGSVNAAPFGVMPLLDSTVFSKLRA